MTHYQSRSHARVSLHHGMRLGNYAIERQLGAGSQADVFLARDVVLDRLAALKVFPSGAESSNTQSLLREARLIARLDTPYIVRVYHIEQTPALYYVAIEYVNGGSLEACVHREGVLPAQRAVTHALAMSEGLRHAHELGIVHSDINPKNLLISHAGQLKIADFGFAFAWESPTSMGRKQMRGTPLYMAPEVWRGNSATPLSDIYSAGACLYYMLTGLPPFPENELEALRKAHLERAVLAPVGIPSVLVDIIQQCMAKEPVDRLPSALVLGQTLRDFAQQALRRRTRPLAQQAAPGSALEAGATGQEVDEDVAEPAASGLPVLSLSEAEVAILDVPAHAEAVRALAEALASQPPLVVFHGAAAEDLARLLRRFLAHRAERLASLARMEMTVAPGGLLRGIASRLGVNLGAMGESTAPILDRIDAQRPAGTSACHVQLCVSGALDETDAIELVELATRSAERQITLLLSCDDRDATLAIQAARAYQLRFVQIALPRLEARAHRSLPGDLDPGRHQEPLRVVPRRAAPGLRRVRASRRPEHLATARRSGDQCHPHRGACPDATHHLVVRERLDPAQRPHRARRRHRVSLAPATGRVAAARHAQQAGRAAHPLADARGRLRDRARPSPPRRHLVMTRRPRVRPPAAYPPPTTSG